MDEYIEREALLNLYDIDDPELNERGVIPISVVRQSILDMPAAGVAPVRHGRWESHLLPMAWKCSACGQKMGYRAWKYKYMNYCPNCGAKMDGAGHVLDYIGVEWREP